VWQKTSARYKQKFRLVLKTEIRTRETKRSFLFFSGHSVHKKYSKISTQNPKNKTKNAKNQELTAPP
jgi:hypothetical protein